MPYRENMCMTYSAVRPEFNVNVNESIVILSKASLNRNPCKTRLCTDGLTKKL